MPNGFALHIGLDKVDPLFYDGKWIGELNFCIKDAQAMQGITKNLEYFQTYLLINENATRENVQSNLINLSVQAQSGDIVVVSFSGHGGSLPDLNGDEEDKVDETWCLYNGHMIDDELFYLYSKFKTGVRIFVVSDSCHSGTVSRYQKDEINDLFEEMIAKSGLQKRSMSKQVSRISYLKNKDYYNKILNSEQVDPTTLAASVKLLSGCQDNQKAYEGWGHGVLTQRLLEIWDNGNFTGNYKQFHKRISAEMMDFQTPNLFDTGQANQEFSEQSPFFV